MPNPRRIAASRATTRSNLLLFRLARAFFKRYPMLKAVAFYGSRASGLGKPGSDYDVLLFLPGGLDWNERHRLGETVGRLFGIQVEVNVASPRSVEWHYRLFPDFRFSLKDAIIFGDSHVINGHNTLPPVARQGLWDSVVEAEMYRETAEAHAGDAAWQAEWYFRALRKILIAEAVIAGEYGSHRFRETLQELLGPSLARKMNRPSARYTTEQIALLKQVTRQRIAEVKAKVASLPENESDHFLANLRAQKAG